MPDSLVRFRSADEKAHFVRNMFDRIAHRYDLMNRLMTGGQDIRWRRLAIEMTGLPPSGRLLDIACGTGDLAFTALSRRPRLVAAGDFSLRMLIVGRQKRLANPAASPIHFLCADGLALPFRDNSFDAAVTGFSLRNVSNIDRFLAEMRRVVRPGGRVVLLEITPVQSHLFRPLFQFYFHHVVPFLGGLLSGSRQAYTYLPQSVDVFLNASQLQERMESSGLIDVAFRKLGFGTVALHWGTVAR